MTLKRLFKACLVLAIMAIPTCFLFGPIGGFHHMILFGIFRYMFWNGEDPSGVDLRIGEEQYEVLINPYMLALTVAVWLALLAFVIACVRSPRAGRHPPQPAG